ncbi:uncharacterized protein LAESUDRAFT_684714 [Laetiporus sulphureus 93-53]|uniref:DUF6533 domain-containing protein n=1 Tax=Laetiporus sulphureus 93-53 TaxID=1314785 RepID=A0A165CHQ4_9APHY|nr:uncharacterized protein LAESUDRAFT_684714 [Laetiporus sulphureus 93-53]KZT02837.1 hypothetical protein LAESUDRAFT_684714 [Laetiporus sulphureus 93-53]
MIIYDFLLTLGQDVRHFWSRKLTLSVALYFLTRVTTLAVAVFYILFQLLQSSSAGCKTVPYLFTSLEMLSMCLWAVFSALRVHAISNRKKLLTVVVLGLGLVPVATNFESLAKASLLTVEIENFTICVQTTSLSNSEYGIGIIATRSCAIANDALVLVLTWYHAYGTIKIGPPSGTVSSLALILLRNGAMYFGILLAVNVSQVVVWLLAMSDVLDAFNFSFTSIMMSRCMLDLHEAAFSTQHATDPQAVASLRIEGIDSYELQIGDIGEAAAVANEDRLATISLQAIGEANSAIEEGRRQSNTFSADSSLTGTDGRAGYSGADIERNYASDDEDCSYSRRWQLFMTRLFTSGCICAV